MADIRPTIVPNYVTRSGYTEDIPSRSKAAYSWTRSGRMGLMADGHGRSPVARLRAGRAQDLRVVPRLVARREMGAGPGPDG